LEVRNKDSRGMLLASISLDGSIGQYRWHDIDIDIDIDIPRYSLIALPHGASFSYLISELICERS
jgi:hypothetical protein